MMYATGGGLKEVAGNVAQPVCQTAASIFARTRNHLLGIKQDAESLRISVENRRNQPAMAATDVNNLG